MNRVTLELTWKVDFAVDAGENNICITKRPNGRSFVTWLSLPLLICLEGKGQLVTAIKDDPLFEGLLQTKAAAN